MRASEKWDYRIEEGGRRLAERSNSVEYGGGGGDNGGMETDISLLKYRADAADQRMERIEGKLDTLIARTAAMPTINGMWGMIATVLGLCIASVGIIIAVLTWLQGFHH